MKQQIEIHRTKMIAVKEKEKANVESIKFISPSLALNSVKCGACQKSIGEARPIAVAWAWTNENDILRPMRLCNNCCKHLINAAARADLAVEEIRALPYPIGLK